MLNKNGIKWLAQGNSIKTDWLEKVEGDEAKMAKIEDYKLVAGVKNLTGNDTSRVYYFALYDETIKAGDIVVMGTVANPVLGIVDSIISKEEGIEKWSTLYKSVLGKVNMSAWQENEDRKKRLTELDKQMKERQKIIKAREDEDYFAGLDDEYAELLKQKRELMGV